MREPIFEEDYTTPVLNALKKHDSGHGWMKRIDCCLTGKDADREGGAFGIEVQHADDDKVICVAHGHLTVAGTDVTLRADFDTDDELAEAVEKYLDEAESIVMGAALAGEWGGDEWSLWFEQEFTVELPAERQFDNDADFSWLAEVIIERAWEEAKGGLEEFQFVSEATNRAAGWWDDSEEILA